MYTPVGLFSVLLFWYHCIIVLLFVSLHYCSIVLLFVLLYYDCFIVPLFIIIIHIYIYIYIYIFVCSFYLFPASLFMASRRACLHWLSIHIYIYNCVYMYVCTYIYIYIYIHSSLYTYYNSMGTSGRNYSRHWLSRQSACLCVCFIVCCFSFLFK